MSELNLSTRNATSEWGDFDIDGQPTPEAPIGLEVDELQARHGDLAVKAALSGPKRWWDKISGRKNDSLRRGQLTAEDTKSLDYIESTSSDFADRAAGRQQEHADTISQLKGRAQYLEIGGRYVVDDEDRTQFEPMQGGNTPEGKRYRQQEVARLKREIAELQSSQTAASEDRDYWMDMSGNPR